MKYTTLIKKVQRGLSPDLLKGRWKVQTHPLEGHCYIATEALFHILPDKENWKPMVASYNDEGGKATHWWLVNRTTGKILDPTREQYGDKIPPYHLGKGTGFLTKLPSKRAQIIISNIGGYV